jgi:hypothetical protein
MAGAVMSALWSGLVAAAFSGIHLWAGRVRFLDRAPRSLWLSAAGGVSVAYVFLHLLPELQEHHRELRAAASGWAARLEESAYLLALAGLAAFYGLERLAVQSRRAQRDAGQDRTGDGVFAVHLGAFALYNAVIGYLLVHGERDNLLAYALAMGLHFVVNDRGLRAHHKDRYDTTGRWLLAAAVFAGWWLGTRVEVAPAAVSVLVALLAGGMILNVLKEELPEERESRFAAFLAGAVLYGALLLST